MYTLAMTAGEDKDLILIVRINLDTEYMYFSDTTNQITLSGTVFDGKVISKNSISEATKDVDVTLGGTIGQVGSWRLSLARYTSYTNGATTFDDFFNDFAPATSKPVLTSKTVDVGVVWAGATLTSEITWLYQFYIENYDWTTSALNLECIEYDELVSTQVPYYVLQNEFDNGISYFTNASEDSYGQAIPIVYGDFTNVDLSYTKIQLVPTVRIDKKDSIFLISSHILHTVNPVTSVYRYLENAGTVLALLGVSSSIANTRAGHKITLDSDGSLVYGTLYLQPKLHTNYVNTDGDAWDYTEGGTNKEYAFDDSSTSYCELIPNREFAVKMGTSLSQSELGVLGGWSTANDVGMYIEYDTTDTAYPRVKYYHPTMGVNSGYSPLVAEPGAVNGTGLTINYYIGNGTGVNVDWSTYPKKHESGIPWTIDELQVLQFHIQNKATSTGNLRIKNIVFRLFNISVTGTDNKIIVTGGDPLTQIIRSRTNYAQRAGLLPIKFTGTIDTNIYAYCKGMMYESWID